MTLIGLGIQKKNFCLQFSGRPRDASAICEGLSTSLFHNHLEAGVPAAYKKSIFS